MPETKNKKYQPQTNAIYSDVLREEFYGSVITPVFHGTYYVHPEAFEYMNTRYPRFNTLPNHLIVQDKLAKLEGADAALVATSGMAVISGTLLSLLKQGDHVIFTKNLYGGTDALINEDLVRFGIEFDFVDVDDTDQWQKALKPNTVMFYTECTSNPLLQIPDHGSLCAFAKKHNLLALIDNTFATPVSYQPIETGYDLVLHSATKYLNGHCDLAAGVVAGRQDLIDIIRHRFTHLGNPLDPQRCYLLERGLKTLSLRVRQQESNAMAVAKFLESSPVVESVRYPGLESHPQHDIASKYYSGYGALVCFEIKGGVKSARRLGGFTKLIPESPSLGGVDSNFTLPSDTVHQSIGEKERERSGVIPGLIRLSVGAEEVGDLIADLENGFEELYAELDG